LKFLRPVPYNIGASGRAPAESEGGKLDRRIDACTKILQSNLDFNALANRGISYKGIGQYDHALVGLNEAIHLESNIAGLYLERGLAYDGKGDHELAIADFSEAIRRDTSLATIGTRAT
jgi:tetratricopeptide (TPR) repeat protein